MGKKGEKGYPGYQGPMGIPGIPGDDGEPGFTISGEKGAKGTSLKFIKVSQFCINFPVPILLKLQKGIPGARGDRGPPGDVGDPGISFYHAEFYQAYKVSLILPTVPKSTINLVQQ